MNAIEVKNISKHYQDKVIFSQLTFHVEEGEMVAIIGDSGVGKTTLLNCLGQLEKIDSGQIFIQGSLSNYRHRKYYFKSVFGFLFQNFALIDNESVYENLNFITKDKKQIKKYLEEFGLGKEYLTKKVYQLSGGEQQRVALIRVLLKKPRIVFADEPTASLDDENSQIVMRTLQSLKNKGVTVIVVTHDKGLLPYFDKVIELKSDKSHEIKLY
ncbi:ABC transporter ATP-binding protein [Streptococcus phocae subsp. phocae]|uniref:Bacteriocin ABC transporter ATP-binding protein n=1 Tax=Streptococcus phocae TaxID=119224 RepID=A0A0P6SIU9_9STRE|nr:ABC transporter ATP-binding protein [Streptococcus phocae]KGR72188.1 bacteriocin ABC transporter ATP-binding protein [Streptococcus phocae subsp. salmonis]KPJ22164.1 bacteriocin ABC transporter ATP-binding protein [Streptococcus phocae]